MARSVARQTPATTESEAEEVLVEMTFKTEKVHSRVFAPVTGDALGSIYIPRATLEKIGNPDRLEIIIRPRD